MTIKELLKELSKERYDKKNLPFYIRKEGVGCWEVVSFSNEDSGFYLNAGKETNPQGYRTFPDQSDTEYIDRVLEDEVTIDSKGNGEF